MPMRPSHDRPVNDPLSRMGFIRYRSIDGDFERLVISYPGYGLQPGETPEPARLGARARSQWHQEAGLWNIRAPDDPRDRDELLVDGRPDIQQPPALGWPMTAQGFGIQFPDAVEKAVPSSPGVSIRIAWHPTGKAVLCVPTDSNGDLEIWEWIPGTGFGKKYHVLRMWEMDDDVQSAYNGINGIGASQWSFPRPALSGHGAFAFSPDGNWLAWVGDAGSDHDGEDLPIVAVPFNLQNGLDLLHPQFPAAASRNTLGDGNAIAWSPDNQHVVGGFNVAPYIRAWNWNQAGFFQTAEADPASPPDDTVSQIVFNREGTFLFVGTLDEAGAGSSQNPKAWVWSPDVGWGAAVAAPSSLLNTSSEVYGLSVTPGTDYVVIVATHADDQALVYEFDASGGGSWGARTQIDDWNADSLSVLGGKLNNNGTLLVVIGESGSANVARLYALSAGVATFIEELSWGGNNPYVYASVAWRP